MEPVSKIQVSSGYFIFTGGLEAVKQEWGRHLFPKIHPVNAEAFQAFINPVFENNLLANYTFNANQPMVVAKKI